METWLLVMDLSRTRVGDGGGTAGGPRRVKPLGFLLVTGHEHQDGRSQTN